MRGVPMLREAFTDRLKQAMKARSARTVSTVRLILAALKERDVGVDDEDVLSLLHHGAGEPDRVPGVLGRGDRTREPRSCHHRGVEFSVSRRGERGATASVE